MTTTLTRRLSVLLFAVVVFTTSEGSAASAVQWCPAPYSADEACILSNGIPSFGCAVQVCPECCESLICEYWDNERQEYYYYWVNYLWCEDCCAM